MSLEQRTSERPNRDKQKKIIRSHAHDIARVALTHIQCTAGRLETTGNFDDFRYVGQWLLEDVVSQLQARI